MEYEDYKDEELAKLYANTLQLYDDQLSVMEAVMVKTAECRHLLVEMEQEMIDRGFKFNEPEEEINESVTS